MRRIPVTVGASSGGGNFAAPASDSRDSVTPTAKKPIGRIANTRMREPSTAQSGASHAGARSPASVAYNGGLRVKNTLTTVQSITSQTLRNAPSMDQASSAIESRLIALSQVHNVLTVQSWAAVGLHDIVGQAVEPYRSSRESRIHLQGPPVQIPPRMALALAMALQELATNAVKYGALSNGDGRIRIRWTLNGESASRRLHLIWEETEGPPVRKPARRGFGKRLIERSLAEDLDGEVRIEFAPTGVVCSVDAPLAN